MSIKVLDPIVASRIAAGEVVERPSSALRELLDNSIDAGASDIQVYMEEGGIKSLCVKDNGCGISKEDLGMACKSHATSKISTLDDLFSLNTLGFRGEALCSISSCSTLTISSNGYSITVDNGIEDGIVSSSVTEGTTITMDNLFDRIPARKEFLKRPSSEAAECRKVFLEKALGFEKVHFCLYTDGQMDIDLPSCSKKERVIQVMSLDRSFLSADTVEYSAEREPVKLYAVSSGPACYKRDRTQIKIFMNNRVIDCYPFVQAIVNAYSVALPGGAFPFFYLFIENSPSLVDFNIHPAKRECKIRNQSFIYSTLTVMVRDTLMNRQRKPDNLQIKEDEKELFIEDRDFSKSYGTGVHTTQNNFLKSSEQKAKFDSSWFEKAKEVLSKTGTVTDSKAETTQNNFTYIGQAFKTFLVVEKDSKLLFIDQHAAHERLLYDEVTGLKDIQQLVVPYRFETNPDVDSFLVENSAVYAEFGINLARVCPMVWEVTSLPAAARKTEGQIVNYIQNATGDIETLRKEVFAVIACHSAIKSGDTVDDLSAVKLLERVFRLDALLCPHGRSFVFEISKEQLFREVGRTL